MKRRMTLSLVITLSVLLSLVSLPSTAKAKQRGMALAFPESATAPPKQRCTITPSGPAQFVDNNFDAGERLTVAAMWNGRLNCDNPTPLEGATIEVRQRFAVHAMGCSGCGWEEVTRVTGPTQIVLGIDSEKESPPAEHVLQFHGRTQGDVACDAGVCTLSLETRANGPRGSHLRSSAVIEVAAATGEVLSFTPDTVAIITDDLFNG